MHGYIQHVCVCVCVLFAFLYRSGVLILCGRNLFLKSYDFSFWFFFCCLPVRSECTYCVILVSLYYFSVLPLLLACEYIFMFLNKCQLPTSSPPPHVVVSLSTTFRSLHRANIQHALMTTSIYPVLYFYLIFFYLLAPPPITPLMLNIQTPVPVYGFFVFKLKNLLFFIK